MKKGSKTSRFGTSSRINHDSSTYYGSRLYAELGANNEGEVLPENAFPAASENTIILGSSEHMEAIPDTSVHLMVTSPPYNVTKEYDEDLSLQEYLSLLRQVFAETYRVLVNGGRACVNVANLGRRPYLPLSDFISQHDAGDRLSDAGGDYLAQRGRGRRLHGLGELAVGLQPGVAGCA